MNDFNRISEYFNVPIQYVQVIANQIIKEYRYYKAYNTLKETFKLDEFIDFDNVFNKHNWNIINPLEGFSTDPQLRRKQLYNLLFIRVKNSLIKEEFGIPSEVKSELPKIWQDIDIIISTNFTKEEEASLLNPESKDYPKLLAYLKDLVKQYNLSFKRSERQLIIC